ncbi:MAG: hypothetical protein KGQ49_00550 [Verrucomicrobia bacterium]|nr:hypothetical protein [Verrucomicrobiota bacterium]MBU6445870.1 hypothetical protein [Verrucomicrobiota bacterium]MDE3046930.1 hypothetical protein [Verrucomicrobiota bacterium]
MEIQEALSLIDDVKKKAAKTTLKQLNTLLIEYILANIAHNTAEMKEIAGQISKTLQTYEQDNAKANELVAKLKAMKRHPGLYLQDLPYLQDLVHTLRQDLSSGNMSNL